VQAEVAVAQAQMADQAVAAAALVPMQ